MAKRILHGTVVSNKADKTIVVEVFRKKKHPLYEKIIKIKKRYKAHDANNECQMGAKVSIIECRPYSKDKKFEILKAE